VLDHITVDRVEAAARHGAAGRGEAPLERDAISMNRHPALSVCLSMSFSQNRLPLLRDMR
jgi:hypothetical protein